MTTSLKAATGRGGIAVPDEERAAFEAIYLEQYPSVLRVLQRRLDNDEDAAELVQETYLRAFRYRDQPHESLKALLFRIAINLANERARRDRTRHTAQHAPIEDYALAAEEMPQDEQLVREQRLERIVAAVQELPEKCRQVFVLSRFHGLRHKEVAARCSISTRMVEKHLTRGMALIRKKVGEKGGQAS